MDRRFLHYFFVITLLFFIGIIPVSAKEDCTSVKSGLDLYDSYEETLKNTDCTDTSDVTIVNTCNETNQQKNLIISKIMKLNDENQICSSEKKRVNKIIKDNKDNCGKIFDDDFNNFVKNAMAVFYVVAPILLILFGSLDFAKATVASDPAALKKASTNFAKRIAATLLLFLTPTIINLILSFNMTDKYLSGNAYTCNYKYSVFVKKYKIKYVSKGSGSKTSSSVSGKRVGNYIIYNQWSEPWGSEILINSPDSPPETVGNAGCAVVSTAIQIINSGIVTEAEFNPSIFNKWLRNYVSGDDMNWGAVNYQGKNGTFKYDSSTYLSGMLTEKAIILKQYLEQGYYPVIQVRYGITGASHYVAVLEVNGTDVIAGDPADGNLVTLNTENYQIASENLSTQTILYKVEK